MTVPQVYENNFAVANTFGFVVFPELLLERPQANGHYVVWFRINSRGRIRVYKTTRLRGQILALESRPGLRPLLLFVDPKNYLFTSCDRDLCEKIHMQVASSQLFGYVGGFTEFDEISFN